MSFNACGKSMQRQLVSRGACGPSWNGRCQRTRQRRRSKPCRGRGWRTVRAIWRACNRYRALLLTLRGAIPRCGCCQRNESKCLRKPNQTVGPIIATLRSAAAYARNAWPRECHKPSWVQKSAWRFSRCRNTKTASTESALVDCLASQRFWKSRSRISFLTTAVRRPDRCITTIHRLLCFRRQEQSSWSEHTPAFEMAVRVIRWSK